MLWSVNQPQLCIAVRVSRAAASQQRVLELMHRVSGYTLRVPFRLGRLASLMQCGGSLRPGRVAAAGERIIVYFELTMQQLSSFTHSQIH